MRIPLSVFLFVLLVLFIDLYVYRAIYRLMRNKSRILKIIISSIYITITLGFIAGLVIIMSDMPGERNIESYNRIFIFFALLLLIGLPKLIIVVFQFINDLYLLILKLFRLLFTKSETISNTGRRDFITKSGIIIAGLPFLATFYGIVKGRFNYQIINTILKFANLPVSFNGFKIVQISDFHISCFIGNESEVEEIVELINNLNPDIIVFTGDMINNYGSEMNPFLTSLEKLNAKYGKFAILGNHDYGDYSEWETVDAKELNFNNLVRNYETTGFNLLRNESLSIQINNERIDLIAVENYGKPPFPKYGDLIKAMENTDANNFSILLSHDPSHWREQVIVDTSIDLTLSGHTHGMQFGIDIPGFKWSPIQYKYPEWAGLYKHNKQYLYVNRGIGYIGLAARVGVLPEITLIELQSES